MEPAEEFLARRPRYSRAHVEEIATACEGVVPFCGECKDWHFDAEPHSGD
ncbi:hypothetical protein ABZ348_31075 [Streptomyces sp. NPDC005963]